MAFLIHCHLTPLLIAYAIQGAMLEIRQRYGKNAVVKGLNMLEGATTMERNMQIGGT